MSNILKPLYPYFGGKRRAAKEVWSALGQVDRYIEPFFGSGAVLLGNPNRPKSELINDLDHHIANLWRALQHDPEEVWRVASAPSSEVELRARHTWLKAWQPYDFSDLAACDPYAAGVWLWVACVAISPDVDLLARGDHGRGIKGYKFTRAWFDSVCERVARMQVLCGDWSRCVTPAALAYRVFSSVGVFLDPPYGVGIASYTNDGGVVAKKVWNWAVDNGNNPRLRIVVAGYEDGRELPEGWTVIEREEAGGYGRSRSKGKNQNHKLERLWLSPYCLRPDPDK